MLNGAPTLFPIVSSNDLIAFYCSHVAFNIQRYCATPLLCAGSSYFFPSSRLSLSLSPAASLHLSYLLLASICLICPYFLAFFFFFLFGLTS